MNKSKAVIKRKGAASKLRTYSAKKKPSFKKFADTSFNFGANASRNSRGNAWSE